MKQVKMETSNEPNDNNNKDKEEAKLWKQKTDFEKQIKEKEESLDFAILHSNYCEHQRLTNHDPKYDGRFKKQYNRRRKYNRLINSYNQVMNNLGITTNLKNNGPNPSYEYSTVASNAKNSSATPPMAPSKTSTPSPSTATHISTGAASSILPSFQPSKMLRTNSARETSTTETSATEVSTIQTSATEPYTARYLNII